MRVEPITGEVLVWFDTESASDALAQLGEIGQVTQVLPPRLALAVVPADDVTRVLDIEWTLGVFQRGDRVAIPDLSVPEQLFVAAWERRAPKKARPGGGLDWDAPGYLPPDPPPRRGDTSQD